MWNCKLIVGEYGILLRQQHKPLFTKRTDLRAGVNHGSQYRYVLETVPEAMEFSRNLRENRIIYTCVHVEEGESVWARNCGLAVLVFPHRGPGRWVIVQYGCLQLMVVYESLTDPIISSSLRVEWGLVMLMVVCECILSVPCASRNT